MEIEKIICDLSSNEGLNAWSEHGWCRKWTGLAMDLLEERTDLFEFVEAVEIEIGPRCWHTFVAARSRGGELYLLDGVGYYKNDPYFGAAKDAPESMKSFRRDGILMTERANRSKCC